jgi:serine/threonine-protein kinase
MIGKELGRYLVVDKLGQGGMGEVYLARDARLGRDVAIKVLPEAFHTDADRIVRFEREAKMLAALNHPNIAALLSMEEAANRHFLVMELVAGETLAEQVQRGPLPLTDALDVARQVADALAEAHERGIIHRDLKPANVKVRPDGTVKVLDFGLAKALDAPGLKPASVAIDTDSPTVLATRLSGGGVTGVSQMGVILGTAPYMSPEQAKGKAVDRRADIWAFGCVLYELLTGKPAFSGETISESLAAIMRDEPDWAALPPATPTSVSRLLRRCLIKDPRERLSDVGVARLEIRDANTGVDVVAPSVPATTPVPTAARRAPSRWLMLGAGVLAGAAIAAVIAVWNWPTPKPLPTMNLSLDWPGDIEWVGALGTGLAISPDGTHVAYIGRKGQTPARLFVRDLRTGETREFPSVDIALNPSFSHDGSQVGFIAGGKLWRAPVGGGTPFEIGTIDGTDRGVAWSADGYVYSGGSSGISRLPENGGSRETITTVNRAAGEVAHRFPAVVPGGRGVLFTIFKGPLTEARVAVVDLQTRSQRILIDRTSHSAVYVPTGHLLHLRESVLMAAPFDPSRLEVTGAAVPVLSGVRHNNGGAGHFGVADTGTLVYMPDEPQRVPVDAVWVDRTGRTTPLDIPSGPYANPALSPDGTRIAMERIVTQGRIAVAVWDLGRRAFTTVTRDAGLSEAPVWMPDGVNLVMTSRPVLGAVGRLTLQRADGSGTPTQLATVPLVQRAASTAEYAGSVVSDGTQVIYADFATDNDGIKVLDLSTKETRMLLPPGRSPRLSPDRRWLAYRMLESGLPEVFVSPYPNVGGGRWQMSTGGGTAPRWSRDGKELFFRGLGSRRSQMLSVKVPADGAFATARPQVLFDFQDVLSTAGLDDFDVAPDGRFLFFKPTTATPDAPHVIVNWFETLKRTAPPGGKPSP